MKISFPFRSLFILVLLLVLAPVSANAQVSASALQVSTNVGVVSNIWQAFQFIANVMRYLGWAGVVIGVVIVIALLIYRLIGSDDESTMKTVQGGITKAVIIVIIGILLVGAGFLVTAISGLIGGGAGFVVPSQLIGTT